MGVVVDHPSDKFLEYVFTKFDMVKVVIELALKKPPYLGTLVKIAEHWTRYVHLKTVEMGFKRNQDLWKVFTDEVLLEYLKKSGKELGSY